VKPPVPFRADQVKGCIYQRFAQVAVVITAFLLVVPVHVNGFYIVASACVQFDLPQCGACPRDG
jgi:hypothetical protein